MLQRVRDVKNSIDVELSISATRNPDLGSTSTQGHVQWFSMRRVADSNSRLLGVPDTPDYVPQLWPIGLPRFRDMLLYTSA